MSPSTDPTPARAALDELNRCWQEERLDDLARLLDPDVVMVAPGFGAAARGRDEVLEGFRDFVENARLVSHVESDHRTDAFGECAVASYRFETVYERGGARWRSTGRDLWVLRRTDGGWRAIWRTLSDVAEERLPEGGSGRG